MIDLLLIAFLEGFVLDRRKELIDRIIENRTRYITVVLEDIYQSQNASAVLRTCDCFGIQDVHIIENRNKYELNPDVTKGCDKWLNLIKYKGPENNSLKALQSLKKLGYRIIATTPNHGSVHLEDFNLKKGKTAFFFGNEHNGLSEDIISNADENIKIPMYGFTESFNISVSAAVILHHLSNKLRNSNINWQLQEDEKLELKLNWLKKSIKNAGMLVKRYQTEHNIT